MRYTDTIRNIGGRTVPPEGDWELDIPNTFATFTAPHLVLARVKGRIPGITGSFTVATDPSDSRLEVELDRSDARRVGQGWRQRRPPYHY